MEADCQPGHKSHFLVGYLLFHFGSGLILLILFQLIKSSSQYHQVKYKMDKDITSVHEGKRFPCSQCEYKATEKCKLQKHMKSVHEDNYFHAPNVEIRIQTVQVLEDI